MTTFEALNLPDGGLANGQTVSVGPFHHLLFLITEQDRIELPHDFKDASDNGWLRFASVPNPIKKDGEIIISPNMAAKTVFFDAQAAKKKLLETYADRHADLPEDEREKRAQRVIDKKIWDLTSWMAGGWYYVTLKVALMETESNREIVSSSMPSLPTPSEDNAHIQHMLAEHIMLMWDEIKTVNLI